MKVALLIAPKDFKDESVSGIKLMLEKWGVDPIIVSYSNHDCIGYHGAACKPSLNAAAVKPDDFDALVLIDGPGVDGYKLYDFRPLLDTVKLFSMRKKLICAINNGIKVVARANIIANVKIAMPKDEETQRLVLLYHGKPSKEDMELDGGILTLGNNDRITDFADMMVRKLGAK